MNRLTQEELKRLYEIYAKIERLDADDDDDDDDDDENCWEVAVNLIKNKHFIEEKEENGYCYTLEDFLACDYALINCSDTFHYATTEWVDVESMEHIELLEKSFNDVSKEDKWTFNLLWASRVANKRVLDGWHKYFKSQKTKDLFNEMPESQCCGGSCKAN